MRRTETKRAPSCVAESLDEVDAPLRFSGDVETCFSRTQTYAFIRTKDVDGIYTQTCTRDQSRDRILLQGSLTRRYAEIEESALYMQNAYIAVW